MVGDDKSGKKSGKKLSTLIVVGTGIDQSMVELMQLAREAGVEIATTSIEDQTVELKKSMKQIELEMIEQIDTSEYYLQKNKDDIVEKKNWLKCNNEHWKRKHK